ncbi:MAG: diguanylate cyclase, partial [Xanthobacteraceae bacterium]|nr:diguanylate cyclase [Xanthobacteraceae bacterium]
VAFQGSPPRGIAMARRPAREARNFRTLYAALDEVDVGIVLLDRRLQLRFINRAFPRVWRLPDHEDVTGLDFEGLMRLVVTHRVAPIPETKFEKVVQERIDLVRDGATEPRHAKLSDGQVIRINCKPLPDGGRMLIYTDVTDLFEMADRLEELARTDFLTGLFNRRHFLSLADAEWNRYQRYRRNASLLMIDIDRFKVINDTYGHDAGDQVLVGVAEICREHRRKADLIARFGGDELVIMLPETSLDGAIVAAERLRKQTEARMFTSGSPVVRATLSIGAAQASPDMNSVFDLMKRADLAVYAAKTLGRNRVCTPDALSEIKR